MRRRWLLLGALIATLAALAVAWRHTALADWTQLASLAAWAHEPDARIWLPLLVLSAYTPASLTLFPRPVITLFAVATFGPWIGFALAFTGILLAALATYALGMRFDPERARLLEGARAARLRALLQRQGVLAVTAVRLVPVAPFAVVNAAAGALRVRLHHFMLGSALGILPGTAMATVLGDRIAAVIRSPDPLNLFLIAAALCVLVGVTFGARRSIARRWMTR
jgi:phospholipase D1/2